MTYCDVNFAQIKIQSNKMALSKADKRSIKNTLLKLNGFLEADKLVIKQFDRTLQRFTKRFSPKIGIIDFKYFSEQRLVKVRRHMLKNEKIQNISYSRNLRKLERICLSYIELRKLFCFDRSTFIYEDNYLLYCHLGTSKNDHQILNLVFLDERYIKLNIRILDSW